jgi:hypothetical protein
MTDERRYGEDEVSEIFEATAAARPSSGSAHPAPVRGLTLAELQEIGMEVGVAPGRIADAAAKVDRRRNATPAGTWLGMPVSAGRTMDLPRAPTDREWDSGPREMNAALAGDTSQASNRSALTR